MIKDKLSRGERRRLESLAQAIAATERVGRNPETIIEWAERFERYIKEGTT